MSNSINGLPPGLEHLAAASQAPARKGDRLGQEDFFNLMITQLKNQDPLKPLESGEFLGQLAQFGTVNGITELQSSFAQLAGALQSNQALQASTMVGRSVLVPSETVSLGTGGGVSGAVDLPSSTGELVISIHDAAGQLVKRLSLSAQEAGVVRFTWDGLSDGGGQVPPGRYRISAEAQVNGSNVAFPTLVQDQVDSVTLRRDGSAPQLNLSGLGPVNLDQVRQVM